MKMKLDKRSSGMYQSSTLYNVKLWVHGRKSNRLVEVVVYIMTNVPFEGQEVELELEEGMMVGKIVFIEPIEIFELKNS
jgi:hypothetical protein